MNDAAPPGAEELAGQAAALDRTARFHKREAARHRRAAQAARQKQAAIEAACRRLGIAVTDPGPSPGAGTNPAKGDIHGRTDSRPQHPR